MSEPIASKLFDGEPEGGSIWPEALNIRDTGIIPDDGGGRIYTTVGFGYKKISYVRADLTADLKRQLAEALARAEKAEAEIERMRPVVEAAQRQACTLGISRDFLKAVQEYEKAKP